MQQCYRILVTVRATLGKFPAYFKPAATGALPRVEKDASQTADAARRDPRMLSTDTCPDADARGAT